MTLIRFEDLAAFVQTADSGGFSAAAREINQTPKSVSKQVARLEAALNVALFERNTRNLHMTEEGRALLGKARQTLDNLAQMQEIAAGSEEIAGLIRLTAPAPFGRKYVAPAIADFCRLYPRVQFDLRLSDQVCDLYGGQFDMAIRIGELADSQLIARKITVNRRILTASPAYIARYGEPQTPEELARHRCLMFTYPGLPSGRWILHNGREHYTVAVAQGFSSDSGEVLREWCLAGLGISLRETWDVHEELAKGSLQRVLPAWEAEPGKLSLVYARRNHLPQRLTVWMDFLMERWGGVEWH